MAKIRLEDIQNELSAEGWKVISTEYVNLDTEMTFECPEGHRVFAPWKKLRTKRDCPSCKAAALVAPKQLTESIAKPRGVKRTLALDQATHTTGYAIFDDDKLIHYGSFTTTGSEDIERFAAVKEWVLSIITNWKIDFIAMEGIQYQEGEAQKMGVTVFQTLARLQGILMMVFYEAKIPFEICPTNTWRHSCGVKGRSRSNKKRSMQLLVQQWYDVKATEDEADAIGIGRHFVKRIQRAIAIDNWEI